MSAVMKSTGQIAGTPLERVARLRDAIAKGGDEAQDLRRQPQWLTDQLIDEGLFRFALPRELGGEDASSMQTIEVLEAISAIDASIGWNVMLGSEINAMAAGGMPKDLAKEVYIDNPRVVMCGGGGPGSKPAYAVEQPDGSYKVWGESTFISGCHNSEWCFMGAPILDDGQPPKDAQGNPIVKMWFLHRSQWEIVDTWNVAGLRGSGSHNVRTDGGVVEPKWLPVELMLTPALYDNPVFRIPVPLRLAYNKVAIALGIARGALEAFVDLANNKVPMLSASKLLERPSAQYRMGEMSAKYRAARAYVMEAMAQVEDELRRGAETPSAEMTINARRSSGNCAMPMARLRIAGSRIRSTRRWGASCSARRRMRSSRARAVRCWAGCASRSGRRLHSRRRCLGGVRDGSADGFGAEPVIQRTGLGNPRHRFCG